VRFDRHTLVLLRRPPDAPDLPAAELERIQELHLAHLTAMRERRVMAVAGPFDGQADETLRGLCVYTVPPDEARALAEADPAVRARRLAVDIFTWLVPEGEVSFVGA
jgi:uncharacterized protein